MTSSTLHSQEGATLVEYVLLVALIAVVAIPSLVVLSERVRHVACQAVHMKNDVTELWHDGHCYHVADPIAEPWF